MKFRHVILITLLSAALLSGCGTSAAGPEAENGGIAEETEEKNAPGTEEAEGKNTPGTEEVLEGISEEKKEASGSEKPALTVPDMEKPPVSFEGETLSTRLFRITVPEELEGMYEALEEKDSIGILESLSKDQYGGFVFGISAYQNASEYNEFPSYSRCGRITDANGKDWDLVVVHPTDVQFDYENPEASENYSALSEAEEKILSSLQPQADCVYTPQEEIDTTSIYDEILEKYRTSFREGWDQDQYDDAGMSYMFHYVGKELLDDSKMQCGYSFRDINNDGYDELLLGLIEGKEQSQEGYGVEGYGVEDDEHGTIIYDMYSQLDGEVYQVFSGGARDRYYIADDYGTLREDGSDSAFFWFSTYYLLQPGLRQLTPQLCYVYDSIGPGGPWYVSYSGEPDDSERRAISEEEWEEGQTLYGDPVFFQYEPLE